MNASVEALKRLVDGNRRFVSGLKSVDAMNSSRKREILARDGQTPFAIVLSCADSRVPSEMVFDVGLGDLFVIRVAGNIVAPSLIGSVEFAAANFGCPLVVVMGHTQCGAVKATISCDAEKKKAPTDHLQDIILQILPSVRKAKGLSHNAEELLEKSTVFNVEHSISSLIERSHVLGDLINEGKLQIIGANYDLHTGEVHYLKESAPSVFEEALEG